MQPIHYSVSALSPYNDNKITIHSNVSLPLLEHVKKQVVVPSFLK